MEIIERGKKDCQEGDFLNPRNVMLWGSAAVLVTAVITLLKLIQTYPGFEGTVTLTWAALGLFFVNLAWTVLLIFLLRFFVVKPTTTRPTHILFAALVAFSVQTLVHTDFDFAVPFSNAEQSSGTAPLPTSVNFGGAYDAFSNWAVHGLDDHVTDTKLVTIRRLQTRLADPAGIELMATSFRDQLDLSGDLPEEQKEEAVASLETIQADTIVNDKEKVKKIANLIYKHLGPKGIERLEAAL